MKAFSGKDIFSKNFTTLPLTGQWKEVMGHPQPQGVWLISGAEKNGKTMLSLQLTSMLSAFGQVLYLSADMGLELTFREALTRANVDIESKKIQYLPYTPLIDLFARLRKRQAPKMVIIDNLTRYEEEFTKSVFNNMISEFPTTLFILLAHEEKGHTNAIARHARKTADIIMMVEGLAANVAGRCPGGTLIIDREKAMIYHGSNIVQPINNDYDNNERVLRETA